MIQYSVASLSDNPVIFIQCNIAMKNCTNPVIFFQCKIAIKNCNYPVIFSIAMAWLKQLSRFCGSSSLAELISTAAKWLRVAQSGLAV